ncbi:MAG: thermonuclease family protein [Cyclobacteriaceae bacterium]|nr:thermonuclease family protein [Cyclobacteriaceae bacterium]
MKRLTVTCVLSLVYLLGWSGEIQGKVVQVMDGNTLEVETKEGEKFTVMLFGVDAPELGQEFGSEATSYLRKIALNKKVLVVMKGKDRWGSRMAKVSFANGEDVGVRLIREGMAWSRLEGGEEKQLEGISKTARKGLWVDDDPTPPWIFRRKLTMKEAKSR